MSSRGRCWHKVLSRVSACSRKTQAGRWRWVAGREQASGWRKLEDEEDSGCGQIKQARVGRGTKEWEPLTNLMQSSGRSLYVKVIVVAQAEGAVTGSCTHPGFLILF